MVNMQYSSVIFVNVLYGIESMDCCYDNKIPMKVTKRKLAITKTNWFCFFIGRRQNFFYGERKLCFREIKHKLCTPKHDGYRWFAIYENCNE